MQKILTKILIITALFTAFHCGPDQSTKGRLIDHTPAHKSRSIDVDDSINLVFDDYLSKESLSIQEESGSCQNKAILISNNDFLSCVGGIIAYDKEYKDISEFKVIPSAPLSPSYNYIVKINPSLKFIYLSPPQEVSFEFLTDSAPSDGESSNQ